MVLDKNPDNLSEQEKLQLSIESFKEFCDQFGENDIYKEIFLTTLFEELLHESFHLSNPPRS